jgi:hypothetical protein
MSDGGQDAEPSSYRTPVEVLLSGDSIDEFLAPYESCLEMLDRLESRLIVAGDSGSLANKVVAPLAHSVNLVSSVSRLLREHVQLVDRERKQFVSFPLGQIFRPYDLEFLQQSAGRAMGELQAQAPNGLWMLVAYLQSWVDFIIPSVLAELTREDKKSALQIVLPPSLVQITEASDSLRRMNALERQAVTTVENLKTAAGEGGKERLAQTFETRGKEESDSAANWNWLVMIFVVLGIALPLVAISLEDHFLRQLTGTYGVVIKALIGLPMFALATYSGRISAQHRKMSQHMKTLTAQIDSVKAYVAGLPSDDERELIMTLGRRAFSEPGVAPGKGEGVIGIPPEDVLPALEKAVQSIKEWRK